MNSEKKTYWLKETLNERLHNIGFHLRYMKCLEEAYDIDSNRKYTSSSEVQVEGWNWERLVLDTAFLCR